MNRLYTLTALVLTLVLGACASVPMGDATRDTTLKTFAPPRAEKAGIYIYRNESMGAAVKMDLQVDGKHIGQTASKTYFFVEVPPGKHTVTSIAENTDVLSIDTVAGKLYYVWQEVKMGVLYARTRLHMATEEDGRKGVLESKLANGVQPEF
ncbi:DUF2846 domain-containing protein [Methyloversatilis sp. RAC08]|uniref:DUF2846 domain-containing protein n=1 Tax=Methyloversatilis sp. RAC08 TaxID=1842540 RepID=UPI001CC1445D|nr:DUF2846 domain-containing protein [Methyloversatilis sp. RAC08]